MGHYGRPIMGHILHATDWIVDLLGLVHHATDWIVDLT
jgi:hypothetical protein